VPTEGGTVPGDASPVNVTKIQQQVRILQQRVTRVLTGAIVIFGAQQGKQQ
jgi:hypothetical protein